MTLTSEQWGKAVTLRNKAEEVRHGLTTLPDETDRLRAAIDWLREVVKDLDQYLDANRPS